MRTRVSSLLLATVVFASVAGCGDDGLEDNPTTRSTGSVSPTESASPVVEAATGPVVETDALRMHVFEHEDWSIRRVGTGFGASVSTLEGGLFEVHGGGLGTSASDLDEGAEIAERLESIEDPAPTRVENRVINGVELYVLEGRSERMHNTIVGGYSGGYTVYLDFDVPLDWPDGEALVESMLASIEWKDQS